MEYSIGIGIALTVSLGARWIGFERDRAFYPSIMIVIAFYYALFAVMKGSLENLLIESVFITAFSGLAILGFKRNLWWLVAAFLAHGLFDFFHDLITQNPGVPLWWPMFCLSCDVVMALYLAWLLKNSSLAGKIPPRVIAGFELKQILRNKLDQTR